MPLILRGRIDEVELLGQKPKYLNREIRIFHPGYGSTPITDNTEPPIRYALLSIPAFDDGGIHYETARIACGILAGNRWDGFFSLQRNGSVRIEPTSDGILREQRCFFCLPPPPIDSPSQALIEPYPITLRFKDWRFPHGNLPPLWESIRADLDSVAVPDFCVFTNYNLAVKKAHLIPKAQVEWFKSNNMSTYSRSPIFSTEAINGQPNSVCLRRDIHKIFDERNLCFVPKANQINRESADSNKMPDRATNEAQPEDILLGREHSRLPSHAAPETQQMQHSPVFVGHVFLSIKGEQLNKLWHNRELHDGIRAASLECLFARFAWTIFSPNLFETFLQAKETRKLQIWNDDSGKLEIEEAGPERCQLVLNAAMSRSESPKKRQRSEAMDENQGSHHSSDLFESATKYGNAMYDSDSGCFHEYASEDYDELPRGRARKRRHLDIGT